jgi:cell division topological specificity factor
MNSFLGRLTGREPSSAKTAKERLIAVLSHDRTDIGPGMLETIKKDIIRILSEYIDVDPSAVEVRLSSEGREQHLKADIPLTAPSRRRRSF